MIEELMGMLAFSAAVNAAVDTSMIDALARPGRWTPRKLARALDLDEGATERVLDMLAAIGLASRDAGAYALTDEARRGLAMLPGGLAGQAALWRHTERLLRTGEPFTVSESPAERESSYAAGVASLGRQSAPFARAFAARLAGRYAEILDVGCGSGVWSLAVAERSKTARVTGVDLPAVLDAFDARARELGLAARTARIAGDMHAVRLPSARFDLAIVANVLRLEPPAACAKLIRRVARALRPGGALVVIDALASGTRAADTSRAVYALHHALRTRGRTVHAPERVAEWMHRAGLVDIEALPVEERVGALGAVRGVRR